MSKKPDYSDRKCCNCGSKDTYIYNNTPIWRRCKCGKKDCTGWLCNKCYTKMYDRRPDSNKSIIKSLADHRIGNLDRYSPQGKGFIGAQIVANTLGIDDCNIKTNNFCFYIDLYGHSEYGSFIETKTGSLNIKHGWWNFDTRRAQEYDYLFLVCMDDKEPWKNVERIYAIPWEAVGMRYSIVIVKDPSRTTWYEKFRIDEKPFNNAFHKMDIKKCKVLRKGEKN